MPGFLIFAAPAAGATIAALIVQKLDKTSEKICDCLDVIDKTLVDGFSGRDIEFEKINRGSKT